MMSPSTSINKEKGFTILEALIAFVIFSLGALAIATLMIRSAEMNTDAESRTEALHLAKEKIEEYRGFVTKAEVEAYATGADGSTIAGNSTVFTRTWTVANVVGNNNAILLTVTITWTDVKGTSQSVALTSSIAKQDPRRSGKYLMTTSSS